MLNETNSELEERLDSAAIEEMMKRTGVQIPARIYTGELDDAFDLLYVDYYDRRAIAEQQKIEDFEWNRHYYGY